MVATSQVLTQMVTADEAVRVPVTKGAVEWATRLCCEAPPLGHGPLISVTRMVEILNVALEGVHSGKGAAAKTGRLGIEGNAMFIGRDGGGQ